MNRLTTLLRNLFARPARQTARPAPRRRLGLGLESLEDRFMPSMVVLSYTPPQTHHTRWIQINSFGFGTSQSIGTASSR